ncbi:MAG: polysaccharide lyase 6 family protein, partial [Polaribacter sp.]
MKTLKISSTKITHKSTFWFCLFMMLSLSLSAQIYTDADDLKNAVNAATNGGTFIVKDGTYNDFEATFEKMATKENPIIIKAETLGGVTLTGESHFVLKKSSYITIQGFIIDGTGDNTLVKLEGCNNIRISRNVFELKTTESIKWVFVGGVYNDNTIPFQFPSHHNRIDHNIFQNKTTPGHYITIDGTKDTNDVYYQSQYDVIDYNHFKDNGPRALNEQESIRIGWSEMSKSSGFTTVAFNLFENCDGDPEIVSVKSSDNVIKHNTFIGSYGTLSLRHGNRNRVEGNYFFGNNKPIATSPAGSTLYKGGIRIYGTDHVIINNYMQGLNGTKWDAPITLTLGDAIDGESSSLSKHFRAERVTIAYNTLVNNAHGIEIGFDNSDKYGKDLKDIIIANNLVTGSKNAMVDIVDTNNDQGNNITWSNNLMYPSGTATLLKGATSTSFVDAEVKNENPNIIYNTTDKVWRTTETSPMYANSVTSESIN